MLSLRSRAGQALLLMQFLLRLIIPLPFGEHRLLCSSLLRSLVKKKVLSLSWDKLKLRGLILLVCSCRTSLDHFLQPKARRTTAFER
jgi:hypothetical protein